MLRDRLTILVCTCDSYEDLWFPFFKLLKLYWPDLDCRIILNTETKTYNYEGLDIKSYGLGSTSYGQRMLNHLNLVETPYVLILLDDFFIRKTIDTASVVRMLDFMDSNEEVAAMYCNATKYVNGTNPLKPFYKMNQYAPYKLNMQAAIWRKENLKKYWIPEDNPWRWEIFVNFLTFKNTDVFYSLKDLKETPVDYGYKEDGMGVFRGKWVVEDVKPVFDKHNIVIDFAKRGIYKKEEAVARLPFFSTLRYVYWRLPFIDATLFYLFAFIKRFRRKFNKNTRALSYVDYLAEKEMKKNITKKNF